MARELEMDITYQQAMSIAKRVEGMFSRDREEREAKRSRETGHYLGARALAARYGRGFVSRPVHSALPAASRVPAPPRPQEPYYAPPVSSMPPTRGAITGQSSRPGPSQSQPPRPPRGCFEYGDTRHLVRDCPRARRGAPPQTYQPPRAPPGSPAILPAPAATPPPQPARGGGRGCPRRGGQASYYALPARSEAVASDSVITGIVPICHRDASVLFDPGSMYSYVSSYFAPHLGISRDSLSSPVYVSTLMGDSLVVNRVYRSCLIALSGFETNADLLLLSMVDFDVILGMDWLSPHYAILDCHAKTVTLAMPGFPRLEWRGTLEYTPRKVISFLKAQ
ncbi:uncharacterized protein LOC142161644 isoform X1 [Nicotiana tabacum]|uniref:Uncharacterized protein LOC142161644 isoform X1 n=3 Tax=Nicotiana tabacum TaxID=4097 RepID=A0AC58U4Z6_TOBAC